MKQLVFLVLFLAANALFAYNVSKFVRVAMLGRASNLEETWGQRIGSLMTFFFGQKKVAEEKRSWHHLVIYWGFLILTVASTEMLIGGVLGEWFDLGVIFGETIYGGIRWGVDVANLFVGAAIAYALFRRLVLKPPFVPANLDGMLILGGIFLLVLTHYGHHAWHMAATGTVDPMMPVSSAMGGMLGLFTPEAGLSVVARFSPELSEVASEVHWWGHTMILLGFLNYLPFSKHIHVLGSGPNILLRPQGQRGVMPKLDLEAFDEATDEPLDFGVGKIEEFSWKSLIDNYACTECARCTTYCPAFATDKPLSPMHLIHDLKDEMKDRGNKLVELRKLEASGAPAGEAGGEGNKDGDGDKPANPNADRIAAIKKELDDMAPLVGGRIKDETLWSCTTCGACMDACPVFIDHPLKILQMRTHIVLNDESGRTPGDLTRTFGNIERSSNPWGLPQSDRMKWAKGLKVPTVEENPDAEYLLFVGCAGAYSDTSQKATQALVRCLDAAGVSYAVLGTGECCTGDPARRAGNEFLFQELAAQNVESMNAAKVTKVIASCPHCFHTIKNEYPQFGGNYEVIHHSALLAHLLDSGKLRVHAPLAKRFTYHDSCYLGRWNQVYDEPRKILDKGTVPAAIELSRNREHGFCCGAGGGRMWVEEEADKRVNVNRSKEIVDSGAEAVAVGCPFCKTMISDGVKHFGKDESIEIMDLAEIIAAGLQGERAPEGGNVDANADSGGDGGGEG